MTHMKFNSRRWRSIGKHWQLYAVIVPPLLYILIFKYIPMYGALIAFKDFNFAKGILGSPWAGLKYFSQFFNSPYFWRLIENTLTLSFYGLIVGFPASLLLALALNELRNGWFKRMIQLVTFAPYFISTVVMVSMITLFLSLHLGMANHLLERLGLEPINFLGIPAYFKHIYVWSEVWQQSGYGAIIYMAALAGIDPHLYEASKVDGASRLQKIVHIDLPGIMPAVSVLLILSVGQMMNLGFEKIYLLQNDLNMVNSEVLQTYVFKIGLEGGNFSFAAAVGLFNSVINLILLLSANSFARKISGNSMW